MSATARPGAAAPDDPVRAVARAVLYEGYLLWPYRRSALKNRQRWTFGGVLPRGWCAARRCGDRWWLRCECLLEGARDAELDVELHFLHVVRRRVARATPSGRIFVDALEAGDRRILAWDEATEREVRVAGLPADAVRRVPFAVPAGEAEETLAAAPAAGAPPAPVGVVVRSWHALRGVLAVRPQRLARDVVRLRVSVANTTPWREGDRDAALRRSLVSSHLVLRARRGRFVSQTDPPGALRAHADHCRNVGVWPVLAGAEGARDTVLAAPIILPDHPRIAPESPGDGFDASEIEQLLVLGVLAMGEAERREMAASDPRAREILERTRALSPEALRRLHGAVRSARRLPEDP